MPVATRRVIVEGPLFVEPRQEPPRTFPCIHCGERVQRYYDGALYRGWFHVDTGNTPCQPVTHASPVIA